MIRSSSTWRVYSDVHVHRRAKITRTHVTSHPLNLAPHGLTQRTRPRPACWLHRFEASSRTRLRNNLRAMHRRAIGYSPLSARGLVRMGVPSVSAAYRSHTEFSILAGSAKIKLNCLDENFSRTVSHVSSWSETCTYRCILVLDTRKANLWLSY
jgi:hypothetical protein